MKINESLVLSERRIELLREFLHALVLEWSWFYPDAAQTHINFEVSLASEEGFKLIKPIQEAGSGELMHGEIRVWLRTLFRPNRALMKCKARLDFGCETFPYGGFNINGRFSLNNDEPVEREVVGSWIYGHCQFPSALPR